MLNQLSWLQGNSVVTAQANTCVNPDTPTINPEIKLVLTRLNCLMLLQNPSNEAFQEFCAAQAEFKLKKEQFQSLASVFSSLSRASNECLVPICFITKSDTAVTLAKEQGWVVSTDSEQFITDVVTQNARFFPVCEHYSPAALDLLPFAFYKNAHFQHMLDMEGGHNMIASIQAGIADGTLQRPHYELWFARWVINIAGLNGHVNPKGSIYLTEPVAECMFALKKELDQLWKTLDHPAIDNYLIFRSSQLETETTYTTALGALMRRYTADYGLEIKQWFEQLSEEKQKECEENFDNQLKTTSITPTFKPVVLETLLKLTDDIFDTLTIFCHIEQAAISAYQEGLESGLIPENTPLCFRDIASENELKPIVHTYFDRHGVLPDIEINERAEIKAAEAIYLTHRYS